MTTAMVSCTGDPQCPRCGVYLYGPGPCGCWWQPSPTYAPPLGLKLLPEPPGSSRLSDEDVDRIARRVAELLKEKL